MRRYVLPRLYDAEVSGCKFLESLYLPHTIEQFLFREARFHLDYSVHAFYWNNSSTTVKKQRRGKGVVDDNVRGMARQPHLSLRPGL